MLITLNDHIYDDNISELRLILCKNCKFNFDKNSYNECSYHFKWNMWNPEKSYVTVLKNKIFKNEWWIIQKKLYICPPELYYTVKVQKNVQIWCVGVL